MKYRIEVTEEQMMIISQCLEMASRMICGQIEEHYIFPFRDIVRKNLDLRDSLDYHLEEIKKLLFPDLNVNASYGIGYTDKSDHIYEMYKQMLSVREEVIRKKNEEEGKETSWNVHQGTPLRLTEHPLIKVIPLTEDILRDQNIDEVLED